MKQFLNTSELQLFKGGYLANADSKPVFHKEFVELQQKAHYIVTFANAAKGKDFTGKKGDSLEDLKR